MKKFIIALIFACAIFASVAGMNNKNNNICEAPAIVVEINPQTGWATLIDWKGEAWHYEQEGLVKSQLVIIKFDTMGTYDIYDDEIIELQVS